MDLKKYERKLYKEGITYIGGVDEAGRGPLAGPVVASCVVLPKNFKLEGLNDSKKLSEKKRELFYDIIKEQALAVGLGIVSPEVIDEINIYQASKKAMMIAVKDTNFPVEHLLTDAMPLDINIPTTPIIKGDAKSLSIAAASVIAKVTRDRIMVEVDKKYPMYGFKKHKGYPTKEHLAAIEKYGVNDVYRKSYAPVEKVLAKKGIN